MPDSESTAVPARSTSLDTSSLPQMDPLSSRSPAEHGTVLFLTLQTAGRHLDKSGIENRVPVEAPLLHDLKSLQRLHNRTLHSLYFFRRR